MPDAPLTLVIETATAACSAALIRGATVVAQCHEEVGRGHAERLIPMIAQLPDGGRADHILVDCGPGSFTGIRVGIAAARGLALGWNVPVTGFSSLPVVAVAAFAADPALAELAVVLEGGHGEVFMQAFTRPLAETGPFASLKPEAALAALAGRVAVGNGIRHLAALNPSLDLRAALPHAAHAARLASGFTALDPRPIYGRAPDAKPLPAKPLAT